MTKIRTVSVPASNAANSITLNHHPGNRGITRNNPPVSPTDPVVHLPKSQLTKHGTTSVAWSAETHDSGPNSWNRPHWQDSVDAPAGKQRPSTAMQQPAAHAESKPAAPRKKIVGERTKLYGANVAKKNPAFKPEGDWRGAETTDDGV